MPARHRENAKTMATYYRVYRLNSSLREKMNKARAKRGQTVRDFIVDAVETELPRLTKALADLGIVASSGDERPARLPMSQETLEGLKKSSAETGLPQSVLMECCLGLSAERKRRRGKG